MNNYTELRKYLNDYSKFEYNWDGYYGLPISKDVLESIGHIVNFLETNNIPVPYTSCAGDGEVSLYWKDVRSNLYAELSISPETYNEYCMITISLSLKSNEYDDMDVYSPIPDVILSFIRNI